MNTRSIRFHLMAWYGGLLTMVFIAFGGFIYIALNHYLEENLRESLLRRVRQVSDGLLVRFEPGKTRWLAEEITSRYAPESGGRFVRITVDRTNVLYASGVPKDASFDPTAMPLPGNVTRPGFRSELLSDGKELLVEGLPYLVGDKHYYVEVGAARGPLQAVLNRMILSLGVGVPVVILVAIGGAYVLIGRALTPVARIARSAERITLHNLDERLPVAQTGDELETLSVALNRMITRLNDAFNYTKRFIADASHELRTPLTIMRGEMENVVQTPALPPDVKETIGSTLEEIERLTKIVEGLFALSRLDAGEAQAESVQFDLGKLATTTTEQMCLLAEDKEVSLDAQNSSEVPVQGDRARLKQVIVNLLDNAIKYTPPRGSVKVKTFIANDNVVLEVIDNGIGIPPDALPHVFERFFRVDKGRSRNLGGAGLGLSIVKSICNAHGGQVEAESIEGRGSRFRVILPWARSSNEVSNT